MRRAKSSAPTRLGHQGFTLIELLLIIVVLGIAAATLTVVSTRGAQMSAGMLRQQQALSLANAMLSEVKAMPFTPCDPANPGDANKNTALVATDCASTPEALGIEPGESRFGAKPFDNVNDYKGFFALAGTLRDASNNLLSADLPTVANCTVGVDVVDEVLPSVLPGDAERITVTVICPELLNPVVVDAVRVRYAPTRWQF